MDEDYCARVLGVICRAVLDHHPMGGGLLLNYCELPGAVTTAILPHFGIVCRDDERERMRHAAERDAKSPNVPFAGDTQNKQRAATPSVRNAAGRHLGDIYERLEALQLKTA
jgi:hypothetical protein